MMKLKETPKGNRLALASQILTPTALAAQGVNLPTGMRITSRYFEPGSPEIMEVTEEGATLAQVSTLPGALGAWGCACGGGFTVCAGAGGGSSVALSPEPRSQSGPIAPGPISGVGNILRSSDT
jgi:hypothetical protein